MGKGGGGGAPAQLEPPKTPAPGLPNMPGGFNYSSPYRSQNFGLYPSIAPYQEFGLADPFRQSQHPLGDDSDRRPHIELFGRAPVGALETTTDPYGGTMVGLAPQQPFGLAPQQPSGSGKGPFLPGGPGQNGYMRNNGFWDQMSGSLLDEAQLRNTQAADSAAAAKAEEERLKKLKEDARNNEHRNGSEK